MTKRILVLHDVHGRLFWKKPVQKYIDVVDRVVFLGDYLDPYGDEGVIMMLRASLKTLRRLWN